THTAKAMSGLVATIAYMRLPTAEEYGTLAISARLASDLGVSSLLSFKNACIGVLNLSPPAYSNAAKLS
ncbi:hypothetical protein, partial [Enterobacter cloacae complex sp. CH23B]|uniref:hypothetical protein n=1 Tax=Enterobacter cloacae complex sp. CH23B TaxID=2511986 RepID=UPI001CA4F200